MPRLRFRPVYVSGTAKLGQALFTAMNDWHTAREFAVEAAKREIMRCDDVDKLRHLCLNLMLQTEALKEMVGDMLLNG